MTLAEFKASLASETPPEDLSPLLQALWLDRNDDWHAAHGIAQSVPDADGSWVHAYLHRKEGDLSNAAYWYDRASKSMPKRSLAEEWQDIAAALLQR